MSALTEPNPRMRFRLKLILAPLLDPLPEAVGETDEPEEVAVDELVPLSWMASAWKAAKLRVLSATAFMANTIPEPQWLAPVGVCCLQ